MIELPVQFINTIIAVHGEDGKKWLSGLDELIVYCEHRWQLKIQAISNLSFNFVARATFTDGSKAILKLGMPGKGIDSEIAALQAFNGYGFCKLIDADPGKGVMLLECVEPGESLKCIPNDEQATIIAAVLIQEIQQANPVFNYPFQTSDDWYNNLIILQQRFGNEIIPKYLFDSAVAAYQAIKANPHEQKLLHGDLHHENILYAGNDVWKAIDPKGLVTETGSELIPFLMNNLTGKNIFQTISERIEIFSKETGIDRQRIIQWGTFRSVLSVYWNIEDGLSVTDNDIIICEVFYNLSR